jgi:hypothetical protein
VSGVPGTSLCSGDRLMAPDNVLSRAGQKKPLDTRLETFFWSDPTQISLETL